MCQILNILRLRPSFVENKCILFWDLYFKLWILFRVSDLEIRIYPMSTPNSRLPIPHMTIILNMSIQYHGYEEPPEWYKTVGLASSSTIIVNIARRFEY